MSRTDMSSKINKAGRIVALCAILSLLATAAALGAQPEKPIPPRVLDGLDEYVVYRIDIREDMVGKNIPFFVHRAVEAAKAAKADAIILDINTNGGELGVLEELNDEIIAAPMLTYAFVNSKAWSAGSLLAISADRIVMSPISSIGGAQVITSTGEEISEVMEQKINSMLKGRIRATAKYKGHPVIICEAFIDRGIEIPGLTPEGEVLTLDQEQATTDTVYLDSATSKTVTIPALAAFIATDIDDLLQQETIWPARVLSYEMTWSEVLANWLMKIRPFLILIGIAAVFLEFKTPGVGIPLAVGLMAFGLFFLSSYMADLAGYPEMMMLALGFILLAVEIFVIPGFGAAGVTGIILIMLSLILSMVKSAPDIEGFTFNYDSLRGAFYSVIIAFVGAIPLLWILAKLFPATPFCRWLVLDPATTTAADRVSRETDMGLSLDREPEPETLIGRRGKALTDLRPAGTALVDGRHIDVITEGEFIEKGNTVRILEVHGNVHAVIRVEPEPED